MSFLEANDAVLSVIPNFTASVAIYKDMDRVLQSMIDAQQTNIKAYVLDKELKRKMLMEAIVDESSKLGFWAFDQKNEPLQLRTKTYMNNLLRKRDTMLVSVARIVLAELNTHLPNLGPYGVTAAGIVSFEDTMKAYGEVIDEKSVAFGERVSATAGIERQLKSMQPVLLKLKSLVRLSKSTALIEKFNTAAKVRNYGVRHYNLSGTVVDEEDKLAVHNAQVTVYGPKGKIATELTNENGFYHFLSLSPGEYKAVVEKTDFVERIITFELLPKERRVLDFELEFDNTGVADDEAMPDSPDA